MDIPNYDFNKDGNFRYVFKKIATCLELLGGLFLCDDCLGQIACIEDIANINHIFNLSN